MEHLIFLLNRIKGSASTVGNKAIFMGQDGTFISSAGHYLNTLDVYDSDLTHTVVTTPIKSMRQSAEMCSTTVGGYALFVGGYVPLTSGNKTYLGSIWAVDEQLTVKALASLRAKFEMISATTIDNYALFTGGAKRTKPQGTTTFSSYAWIYNDDLVRTNVTKISQARCGIASATVGDFVLCGGGVNSVDYTRTNVTSYRMIDVYSKI